MLKLYKMWLFCIKSNPLATKAQQFNSENRISTICINYLNPERTQKIRFLFLKFVLYLKNYKVWEKETKNLKEEK